MLPPRRTGKAAPFTFPVFVNGVANWTVSDFSSYVNEGYNINSIIYSAVSYKAKAIANARLRAYTGDRDAPKALPLTHPLALLCARPNPYQSWVEFQQQREIYLNLSGNSYTWLDRQTRDGIPVALWNLRPDRVWIVPEKRGIAGYYYRPVNQPSEGVPMLPRDLIHVKFPNPMDELEGLGYGLSPMASLARSGDVDNTVTSFIKLFFEKGAMPSGLIKTKASLEADQVATIRERWREYYGGYENWADIGVLDVDSEYQRLGMTFDEMGFDVLDNRNESRMLGPFGVPPMLIFSRYGLERNTFSNAEEARRAMWEDTLIPELDLFYADDDYYLSRDDAFVRYDTSKVKALQVNQGQLIQDAERLVKMGMPANQALMSVGLSYEQFEAGEMSFLPTSMRTLENTLAPPAPKPAFGQLPAETPPASDSGGAAQTGESANVANEERDGAQPKK